MVGFRQIMCHKVWVVLSLPEWGYVEVEPRSCMMHLLGCLAGFLSDYGRRPLGEPFLPHLVVCGLSNHYIRGARHISVGCLDLLLVVGVFGP